MPASTESLNRKLYKVLSKYKPKPLDTSGDVTPVEDEAAVFKFTFTKDGKAYGDVFITIDDERRLSLYYGDDVADSPSAPTPGLDYNDTWEGLLEFLSRWAHDNRLKWEPDDNKDHVVQDMARRKHMSKKEQIGEGYYPMGKKASYSDNVPNVKIVIEHTRQIEEGEQRYRNINRIFLENQLGERFLLDTKKPGIARVYARHIAEGGKVNDERWGHINSLCEEYNKMAGFVRATRNGQFNESAQQLVQEGVNHYQSLRETLSKMTGKRGYNMYFESWTPALMEDEVEEANLNELFVQETLDPRIESVMPILSKLHKKVAEMKEVVDLAEWADSLLEGGGGPEASEEPTFTEPVDELPADGADAPADDLDEGLGDVAKKVGGALKKVGSKALDTLGHGSDEELLKDLQKKSGVPASAQHGKPSMAKPNNEGVAEEVDMGQYDAVKSSPKGKEDDDIFRKFREKVRQYGDELEQRQKEKEVDEDFGTTAAVLGGAALGAKLGKTAGIYRSAKGDEEAGLAKPRGKLERLKGAWKGISHPDYGDDEEIRKTKYQYEEDVEEGLDANQKAAGQLGPTEPVGKNEKNLRSKLVGANENFIGMAPQAVAEGQEDLDAILRIIRK